MKIKSWRKVTNQITDLISRALQVLTFELKLVVDSGKIATVTIADDDDDVEDIV